MHPGVPVGRRPRVIEDLLFGLDLWDGDELGNLEPVPAVAGVSALTVGLLEREVLGLG